MNTEILSLETAKKLTQYEKYVPDLLRVIERNKNIISLTSNEFYAIKILEGIEGDNKNEQ